MEIKLLPFLDSDYYTNQGCITDFNINDNEGYVVREGADFKWVKVDFDRLIESDDFQRALAIKGLKLEKVIEKRV